MSIPLRHAKTNTDDLTAEFCTILSLQAIFGALAKCGISLTSESGDLLTDEDENQLVRE